MTDLVKAFAQRNPEIVFEWKDPESEAEGWLVINSLRGGAAGGGTRMRKGLNRQEVEALAKVMEVKFTVSGPDIGGAKSGINFDPSDPRKMEVLSRWYKAVIPLLKNYYGTAGDLNIDEIAEVIPITESQGLAHPQEGIVKGYFGIENTQIHKKIESLRYGVSKRVTDRRFAPKSIKSYKVADLITGYGVAQSVKHCYDIWKDQLVGKRAIIQGWGNVGAAAGYYLANAGVRLVGIIDKEGALINDNGFELMEVIELMNARDDFKNCQGWVPYDKAMTEIWKVKTDIFIPAAGSHMVDKTQINPMLENGLEVISCGANIPFSDNDLFMGELLSLVDSKISVIPDFIANCGMARAFSFLMEEKNEVSDESLFHDTSLIIKEALENVFLSCPDGINITEKALEIALEKLVWGKELVLELKDQCSDY